ncbi:HNH endonuclease, partial [Cellulomonas iranensis]|uniref:HNH endonuclease n=1 Tax=Cellulomonas iranensis TaxID=76862 RepID=UPI001177B84D
MQTQKPLGCLADMAWKKAYQHDYNSRAWRATRRYVRSRDDGLCFRCAHFGLAAHGAEVDHFVPVSKGGTDSPSNSWLLCMSCHREKTQREAQGLAGFRGKLNPDTGWPMPEPDWLSLIANKNAESENNL